MLMFSKYKHDIYITWYDDIKNQVYKETSVKCMKHRHRPFNSKGFVTGGQPLRAICRFVIKHYLLGEKQFQFANVFGVFIIKNVKIFLHEYELIHNAHFYAHYA